MKKKAFPKFGNGKGMKKSIPIFRERESEAFILGNGWERKFPLTPDLPEEPTHSNFSIDHIRYLILCCRMM